MTEHDTEPETHDATTALVRVALKRSDVIEAALIVRDTWECLPEHRSCREGTRLADDLARLVYELNELEKLSP